jgi:hypothetical protein
MKIVKVTSNGNLVLSESTVIKTKVKGKEVTMRSNGRLGFLMIDAKELDLKAGDELPAEIAKHVKFTDNPVLDATTQEPLGSLKWCVVE